MIEFKDITLADKDLIQSFTLGSLRRNCDLSFANLCSWIFLYQTKYAVMDNYLLLRFYAGEELAYMMPVGTGDVKPVLEALIKDAEEMGAKLRMLGVCVGMKADIEAVMPGRFTFTEDRDYFDYIYLRTDLATLKGKKFQAKRNHINKFKKQYPDYEYKPLTPDLVPECLKLEWGQNKTPYSSCFQPSFSGGPSALNDLASVGRHLKLGSQHLRSSAAHEHPL